MEKKIILQRFIHDKVTFGKLILEWLPGHKDIYTIELPWLNNQHDISCIPAGTYNCTPFVSGHLGNVWKICDVLNRDLVRIHWGNFACDVNLSSGTHKSDTDGCVLIGMGIEEKTPMITRSKEAMEYLHQCVGIDNFIIEIRD